MLISIRVVHYRWPFILRNTVLVWKNADGSITHETLSTIYMPPYKYEPLTHILKNKFVI